MNLLNRIFHRKFWNIGFCFYKPEDLIEHGTIIEDFVWLKNEKNDRCYADPFILSVNENYFELLVEEILLGSKYLSSITKLNVDYEGNILDRNVILYDETHYSYPFIYKKGDIISIIPENSIHKELIKYNFKRERGNLVLMDKEIVCKKPVVDATILRSNDEKEFMLATSREAYNEELYLYKLSDKKIFEEVKLLKRSLIGSRSAGNIISINKKMYRPSQVCIPDYGSALQLNEVISLNSDLYEEIELFKIYPQNSKFKNGIHTINFEKGLCVVDGYFYKFSFFDKLYRIIFNKWKSNFI